MNKQVKKFLLLLMAFAMLFAFVSVFPALAESPGPHEIFMKGISFTKSSAASAPDPLPFASGSGEAVPQLPDLSPEEGIDFTGLYVSESDYDIYGFINNSIISNPCIEFSFPSPQTFGLTSYTLQYSADGSSGWANYQHNDDDVVAAADQYCFCIYPDGNYYYRLAYGNAHSNVVYAPLATVQSDFTGWSFDESMFISGVMAPRVGCAKTIGDITAEYVNPVTGEISDVPDIADHILYEWYRVNPLTFAMTKINGASSASYTTTNDDIGYFIMGRAFGDGIGVGGYMQWLSGEVISYPAKAYVCEVTDDGFILNLLNPVSLEADDLYLRNGTTEIPITGISEIGEGESDNAVYQVYADLSAVSSDTELMLESALFGYLLGSSPNQGGDEGGDEGGESEPGLSGEVELFSPTVTMTSELTGDSADQVYHAGDEVSLEVDLTDLNPAVDYVRVAIGRLGANGKIYRFRQYGQTDTFAPINPFADTATSDPLAEVDTETQSYYYRLLPVVDGKVTLSGTLAEGITPASVGIIIVSGDGSAVLSNLAVLTWDEGTKQVYFGIDKALTGPISSMPALGEIDDLYNIPDISFKAILVDHETGDDVVGQMTFKNLNLLENWNELMQLSQALIFSPINVSDPSKGFEIGMDASKLSSFSLKPATISVSGLDTLGIPLNGVSSFNISTLGSGIISNKAYANGTLSFDVSKFSTYKVEFADAQGGYSVDLTDSDLDNVYFAGDTLSFNVSGLSALNGRPVRVAFGIVSDSGTFSSQPVIGGLQNDAGSGTLNYKEAVVTNGTFSADISGAIQSGLPAGAIGCRIYTNMGAWANVLNGQPQDFIVLCEDAKPAFTGVALPDGVTSTPVLGDGAQNTEDLYNMNIAFQKSITNEITGKMAFAGLDLVTNRNQLNSLSSKLTMQKEENPGEGNLEKYTLGVDVGTLTFLSGKGATVSVTSASFDGKTTADFAAAAYDVSSGMVSGLVFDDASDTVSFNVNHFSNYNLALLNPPEKDQLTISGLSADNKVYDGTASATLSGTPELNGVAPGDTVSLSGTPTASFSDKNVGTGKTVSVTGYTLSGADADKYILVQPTLNAAITAKALTVTGIGVSSKTYDGTTAATLTGTPSLVGVVGSDNVSISGTPVANFADKNANSEISIILSTSYILGGPDAGNYTLTQPSKLKASISKKDLIATADNKTRYVGEENPAATITYSGFAAGENAENSGITPPTASYAAAANSPAGTYDIALNGGSGGNNYNLTTVKGTLTVESRFAAISPLSASFDKKTALQADIAVALTLNGNDFTALKKGADTIDPSNYTLSNGTLTIKKSYLATLPLGDTELTFVFTDASDATNSKTLTVTVVDSTTFAVMLSAVPGVTITPQSGSNSPVPIGQDYAFTVNLPDKYNPATLAVKANGTTLTPVSGVYTITNLQADTQITVDANIKTFTLTVSAGAGGTLNPPSKTVSYGDNVTITTLPNTGYVLSTFTVNGVDKKAQIINGVYAINNITSNTTVDAAFSAKQFTVTKNAGSGGTISANSSVGYGSSLEVTVTPAAGSYVNSVSYSIGGTAKTPALTAGANGVKTFSIANVTGNVTITATFATVDKSALINAIAAAVLIDATPYQDSYKTAFNNALAAAVQVRDNAAATTTQVDDATAALNNAKNDLTDAHKKTFTVTVANTTNGAASVDNPAPKYGDNVTITATPGANFALYKIFVNGMQINGQVIKNITSNITVTVLFKSTIPAAVTDFKTTHAGILTKTVATVQASDSDAINAALTDYAGLGAGNQAYLATEYQQLKALRTHLDNLAAAGAVSALIANLDSYSDMEYVTKTKEAKASYDALTPDQKKLLSYTDLNLLLSHLESADTIYRNNLAEQARIAYVNGLVDALSTTIGGGGYANVTAATAAYLPVKNAYDALTQAQKAQITNSAKLAALASAIEDANHAAADPVIDMINALTVVTPDMDFDEAEGYKKEIIEAKNAYDALTADQKALIGAQTKALLDACFASVAVVIEKPMPQEVDQSLAEGLTFTGISDTIADLTIAPPDDYAATEATINVAINSGSSDTALKTELILDLTPRNAAGEPTQPEGKVKIRILLGQSLAAISDTLSVVYSHGGQIYSVPCTIIVENGLTYLEFETDRFSTYALVSKVRSGNNYLSALSASGITLSPAFDKDTLSYSASVANSVTSTTISATAEDSAATVTGSGVKQLTVGNNTFQVIVTAEDNTTKTYSITITRAAASGSGDNSGGSSGGATGAVTPPVVDKKSDQGKTTVGTTVTGTLNTATGKTAASVPAATAEALMNDAKAAESAGQKAVLEIRIETAGATTAASVAIPRTQFNEIADGTNADLRIETGIGSVTFNSKAVETISGSAASGDVSITIASVNASSLSAEVREAIGDRPVYDFTVAVGGSLVSAFGSGSAQICIPYTLKAGEDKNAVVVYYIDDAGKLQTVRGAYDDQSGEVVFTAGHFSKYAVGYNKVEFSDVAQSGWYADAVSFIAARGITTGMGDGKFAPDATLTRGQFIVMLMKAYGISADSNPAANFDDAGNTYYTGYLAAAKRLGIASGIGDNLFAPGRSISRQDMFTLLYRALSILDELPDQGSANSLAGYSDSASVSGYARESMESFVAAGIVSGNGGKLNPLGISTRAQMAQVLYNLLSE